MRQLVILAIIVAAYLFLRKLIRDSLAGGRRDTSASSSRASGHSRGRPKDDGEEMLQDPNCGAFVPLSRALTYKHDGRTLHFCSEECANEYARKLKSGELQ